MFSRSFRGRRVPPPVISRPFDEPIRIDEARLHAWATALGQARSPPLRRPRRGDLPDVDFSRAVPLPRRPGFLVRLIRRILHARRESAPDPPGAQDPAAPPARWPAYEPDSVLTDAEPISRGRAA